MEIPHYYSLITNHNMKKEEKYHVTLVHQEESESYIEIITNSLANALVAARGWLMLGFDSIRVDIYNQEGFLVESYIKP